MCRGDRSDDGVAAGGVAVAATAADVGDGGGEISNEE